MSWRAAAGSVLAVPPGLSSTQAAAALAEHGPNLISEPPRHGVLWRVGRQLHDPMIMLLLAAAVVTVAQRDGTDTLVIALVVVLNTSVGVVQELRAEKAISALRQMAAPNARVMRDGQDVVVPAADVVPGDLLRLEAGDVVPADGEVVRAVQLQCDESALTGESVPVDKDGDTHTNVQAGTTVTRGNALARVTRTGSASALGRIAALVAGTRSRPTPLQRRLRSLATQLTVGALALSALVLVLGVARGRGMGEMALTAVSLSVAAVPESLPAVVTLALALGARRMARRSALVRGLPAVETLGSVSVLATDKTGTLTENRMVVQRLLTPAGEYRVTGTGYGPEGVISGEGTPEPVGGARAADPLLARLLRDVSLCNDASLAAPDGEDQDWRPLGDPTEAALVTVAAKAGLDVDMMRNSHPRLDEVPFDSARGWMATAHQSRDGTFVVYKGAPDVLLPAIGPQHADVADRAARWAQRCAHDGLRVLAVAEPQPGGVAGLAATDLTDRAAGLPSTGLALVGLVAMADPPRADVRSVLDNLRSAGIRLVLITGDHPVTATAIATQVGLSTGSEAAVTGGDLTAGTATDMIAGTSVFARIRPEQKLDIVRNLEDHGHVVAMTGDGVNDAPALRAADIGVAMGRGGTEVARQAADLVLTDDRLATVAVAVEEGRRIHDNVRRFLRYALSGGVAEIAFMLMAPFAGFAVPLLPAQILWINMLTHGLPGVAFGADPADPGAMRRPPRPAGQAILGAGLVGQILAAGSLIAGATLAAAWWARSQEAPWQSTAFLVLGLAQLGVALATRQRARGTSRNWFLDIAVATALAMQVAAVFVPPLQDLLGTQALALDELAVPLLLSAVPGLVLSAVCRGRRHQESAGPRGQDLGPLGEPGGSVNVDANVTHVR